MAKVKICFTADEFHYLAALVGLEIEEWREAGLLGRVEKLGDLRGRLISACIHGFCEVIDND